jgi:hypothetical protein
LKPKAAIGEVFTVRSDFELVDVELNAVVLLDTAYLSKHFEHFVGPRIAEQVDVSRRLVGIVEPGVISIAPLSTKRLAWSVFVRR